MGAQSQGGHFTEIPMFKPHPNPGDAKPWNVRNFGTVGIGMDLKAPGFTMVISNVEKGSPADKSGKLKPGQVIESINGKTLKDRDPREILGDIITEAEAKDGKVSLKIKGQGDVVVSIPVMGSYSETWPLRCPKSDRIVRGMADLLAKMDKPTVGSVMFMLSTGEENDLAVVRKWMKDLKQIGTINWHRGMMGPAICEYYLRTGDASVLPVIRDAVRELEKYMYNGGWGGRTGPAAFTYSTGTGQLHAAGVHCMTFLLMAKLCGVEVDERTLQETLTQFYRFAGHGNVAYGDGFPEGGYVDNGKHSGLALAMSAAALLTPNGESSNYAKARDNSGMKAFYATNWFHAAHTGGGLGEIWHHQAMSRVSEVRPVQYRSYLDTRRWVMELSRRFDGSIGIAGMTDRYDVSVTGPNKDGIDFGTFFALTYTLPRKHLQLFGAPRSKWAKSYQLPVRPWGNEADDIFLSNDPIMGSALTKEDVLREVVPKHSSLPAMSRMNNPNVSNEELMMYLHHPEFGLRVAAMRAAVNQGRYQFIVPFLKADDARLRHLGVLAITGMFKGTPIPTERITPEMFELIGKMIEDPDESWWVTQDAIFALGRADIPTIAKHRDRMLEILDTRDSTWNKVAAMCTLAKTCSDLAQCKLVLPRLLDASTKVWNNAASYRLSTELKKTLGSASPEVKAYAAPLMERNYMSFPPKLVAESGAVLGGGSESIKERLAEVIEKLPGGTDFIRYLPKRTLAYVHSGKEEDKYEFKDFKPNPQLQGRWLFILKGYDWTVTDEKFQKSVDYAMRRTEEIKKKNKTGRNAYKPKYLNLMPDGKGTFWSGDMLIVNNVAEARRMKIRKVKGKEYLLVEMGGFPKEHTPDWNCGYEIYIRQ